MKRISEKDLARLKSFLPQFKAVEDATGVPAEAIAAIWWRESFSEAPPKTPGGPFQFDPEPSPSRLRFYLDKYTNLPEAAKANLVAAGVNNFHAASYFAACHLRNRCTPKITPNSPDDVIMDMIWGYNGRAKYQKGDPKKSFYVYNGFDDAHDGLMIHGSIPDGKGGRKRISRAETRPGAFVVYKQLKGEL